MGLFSIADLSERGAMSRSGYSDDCENLNLYRANVARSISGKRGQAFLAELAETLDAMPVKELLADVFVSDDGDCTLGTVCRQRKIDTSNLDTEYGDWQGHEWLGKQLGIAACMVAEIEFENDERGGFLKNETPAGRWKRIREWVSTNLKGREQ